jgi:hypothetical protein
VGDQRGTAALLQPVLGNPKAWEANETLRRAIEINDGVIQNPRILSFQRRLPQYPHPHRQGAVPVRSRRGESADAPGQLAAVSAPPDPGGQREDDGAVPAVSAVEQGVGESVARDSGGRKVRSLADASTDRGHAEQTDRLVVVSLCLRCSPHLPSGSSSSTSKESRSGSAASSRYHEPSVAGTRLHDHPTLRRVRHAGRARATIERHRRLREEDRTRTARSGPPRQEYRGQVTRAHLAVILGFRAAPVPGGRLFDDRRERR